MNSKKRIVLFFVINVTFNMAASFAHPVTPTLFKGLGLGDYMFGYALAAMLGANFLFSPLWGRLNSYISSRTSLFIACSGYSLGQMFFALAQTETQFIFARIFAGMFTGGVFVSMLNYVINTSDENSRGSYLAISATIQSVGGAFGFFVGGMLGEISVGLAIAAQIIVLFLCGVMFYLACVDDRKLPLSQLKVSTLVRETNPFAVFALSRSFMTVLLATLFAMCTLHNLGQTAFDQSFNYYIKDQFDFSSGYNGVLKALMGFTTLVANSTICIYLMRRTDIRRSIISTFTLCIVMMFGIVTINGVIPFVIVNILFYASSSICLPILQKMTADIARDRDSNLVMGFYNSMKSFGGIIGAVLAGTLYSFNPRYPFIMGLAAFAIATACSVFFYLLIPPYAGKRKNTAKSC